MFRRRRLATLGIAAAMVMALAVGSASANHLSISHGNLFRYIWSELEWRGGFGTIRCPLTLEASFHSATLAKTVGSLIGYVTGATVGVCSVGSMTVLRETLPWHIQYGGFTGELPRFVGVTEHILGLSLQLREPVFGVTCLLRTEARFPSSFILEGITWEAGGNGRVEKLVAENGASIPCGSFTARFEGTARVAESAAGGREPVLLKLI